MKREGTTDSDERYAAWVGFDWGDEEHVWVLQWADTGERERGPLEQTPEALDAWMCQLMSRLNGRRIGLAIEQKHGAVVWMLLKYECVEIYPIHPQAAGQFRQSLYPSGSKSDPLDGELLLELLVHHRDRLHALDQEDEPTRRLLMLVEQRRHWVEEKKRHGNRLLARLKVYFPQVLNWFEDISAAPVLDLLARWPRLEQLQKAQRKTLETFLREHRRGPQEASAWAEQVRCAVAAVQDVALMDSYVLETTALVALLKQMQTSIKKFDIAIAEISRQHPCWTIVQSWPGAGPVMAPRLLAAMGNGKRYQNAHEMQCATGIAPVTVATGRTRSVQFRRACPKFLRQTFHEWAQHSMKSCRWARAYYNQLRAGGKRHHAALRALAFKWQRILFRCWKDGVVYNESRYIASLKKRNSPLGVWLPE
ncbi:MAG TPA: transposase [Bryobacteraceae bacterium]|nr:transposase [Bryobacteraceae bacterium]